MPSLISFSLISSPPREVIQSALYEAPQYVFFVHPVTPPWSQDVSHKHPFLRHPHSVLFHKDEKPSFTPIQNMAYKHVLNCMLSDEGLKCTTLDGNLCVTEKLPGHLASCFENDSLRRRVTSLHTRLSKCHQ